MAFPCSPCPVGRFRARAWLALATFTGPFPSAGSPFTITYHYGGDANFNAATDAVGLLTVNAIRPPPTFSVTANPHILWPPNHKMVQVTIRVTTTPATPAPACRITLVESNEPVTGLDDDDRAPDWLVTGALSVNLRAERNPRGTGRIYTITARCVDTAGRASTGSTTVLVPRDQGQTDRGGDDEKNKDRDDDNKEDQKKDGSIRSADAEASRELEN